MNMNVQFFTILCMASFLSAGSDRPLTLPESVFVGGLAGAGEVLFPGHILSFWMNQSIESMNKKIAKQPIDWSKVHEGGFANLGGQFVITAVANTVKVKGSQVVENWQDGRPLTQGQNIGMSLVSGVAGGVVENFSTAIQLNQQKTGGNALQVCKHLGLRGLSRGLTANATKEAQFALCWQFLGPKGKEFARKYVEDEKTAAVFGAGSVGGGFAVISQPFAVAGNTMKGDLLKTVYTTTLQTMNTIYKEKGAAGLFKGLPQRGPRAMIAVPLFGEYSTYLEKKLKENSKR